jgi:Flp pilus assembly CpaE family ATPase
LEAPAISVLLIDADPRSRHYLITLLAQQGYSIQATASAKEGYISALRDRPDFIVFDPALADMSPVELVKKLRGDRRTADGMLIALATTSDSAQMADLLAVGCNEYLVKSQESIEKLTNIISGAYKQVEETQPAGAVRKRYHGGILAVFLSAKGGTGTSSICANVAQTIGVTRPELEVAVMDLVLPIGSIGPIVGYQGDFNLIKAAQQPPETLKSDFLRRIMPPLETWSFRLLAGAPDPEAGNSLDAGRIPALTNAFREAFDVICVDLGRSLSRISLPIIQEADVVVMITASDLSTTTLTQVIWQYLLSKGIHQKNVYALLNRSVGLEGLSKSDAEKIVGLPIQATIPYLGANFSLANNQHLPILRKMPHDTAVLMIDQVSRQILEIAYQNRA